MISRFNFKLALVTLGVVEVDVGFSSLETEDSIADGIPHKDSQVHTYVQLEGEKQKNIAEGNAHHVNEPEQQFYFCRHHHRVIIVLYQPIIV